MHSELYKMRCPYILHCLHRPRAGERPNQIGIRGYIIQSIKACHALFERLVLIVPALHSGLIQSEGGDEVGEARFEVQQIDKMIVARRGGRIVQIIGGWHPNHRHSAYQILQAKGEISREIYSEIRDLIPIRVPLEDRNPKRTVIAVVELAGRSIKARQTDEVKSVMDSCCTDRIDRAEINVIDARG